MLRLKYLIASCVLALTVGAANANTVTFDVNGSISDGSASNPVIHTVSGTLTVDVSLGSITAVNFIVDSLLPFTEIELSAALPVDWNIRASTGGNFPDRFDMILALNQQNPSLIGFNGSPFNSGYIYHGISSPFLSGGTGSITPQDAQVGATPLPAALPLFATGLGVLGWTARRRKQKAAALAAA